MSDNARRLTQYIHTDAAICDLANGTAIVTSSAKFAAVLVCMPASCGPQR
ncbi:hypothetical protein [Erwinia typographi]|nr:hypothetical protein [Erwinia typographi]